MSASLPPSLGLPLSLFPSLSSLLPLSLSQSILLALSSNIGRFLSPTLEFSNVFHLPQAEASEQVDAVSRQPQCYRPEKSGVQIPVWKYNSQVVQVYPCTYTCTVCVTHYARSMQQEWCTCMCRERDYAVRIKRSLCMIQNNTHT